MARILIIDDTKNIRKMVELTLKSEGHEVETAVDGEEGLTKFGDGSAWDLSIVDQQMPKLEGRAFVQEAKKRDSSTRIIMMTAFATSELASEIMQMGALDFLRKPFATEVLRGAVDAALAHEKAPDEALNETLPAGEIAPILKPGESGFVMPRRTYRFNGFSFWALPNETSNVRPAGFESGVHFQIRNPDGAMSHCFVGLTEHVRQQLQADFGAATLNDDFLTELCGETLSNYFLKNAAPAPETLAVYEVPNRLLVQSRSPVTWGFFTRER